MSFLFANNRINRNSSNYHNRIYVNQQRQEILNHIYSSRRLYEMIVENMRAEDLLLRDLLFPENTQTQTQTTSNTPAMQTQNVNTTSGNGTTSSHTTAGSVAPSSHITAGREAASSHLNTGRGAASSQNTPTMQTFFMDITDMFLRGLNTETNGQNGLTTEQINSLVRNCTFAELSNDVRSSQTTCPITLDVFSGNTEVAVINRCGHVFCRNALYSWLSRRVTCPNCRTNLQTTVGNTTFQGTTTIPTTTTTTSAASSTTYNNYLNSQSTHGTNNNTNNTNNYFQHVDTGVSRNEDNDPNTHQLMSLVNELINASNYAINPNATHLMSFTFDTSLNPMHMRGDNQETNNHGAASDSENENDDDIENENDNIMIDDSEGFYGAAGYDISGSRYSW